MEAKPCRLGDLKKGEQAVIVNVGATGYEDCKSDNYLMIRLMEMGFLSGSHVEILHEGPLGGDPIAVRVRGSLIALRRNEANAVEVLKRSRPNESRTEQSRPHESRQELLSE